jgi:hypothetical protein
MTNCTSFLLAGRTGILVNELDHAARMTQRLHTLRCRVSHSYLAVITSLGASWDKCMIPGAAVADSAPNLHSSCTSGLRAPRAGRMCKNSSKRCVKCTINPVLSRSRSVHSSDNQPETFVRLFSVSALTRAVLTDESKVYNFTDSLLIC